MASLLDADGTKRKTSLRLILSMDNASHAVARFGRPATSYLESSKYTTLLFCRPITVPRPGGFKSSTYAVADFQITWAGYPHCGKMRLLIERRNWSCELLFTRSKFTENTNPLEPTAPPKNLFQQPEFTRAIFSSLPDNSDHKLNSCSSGLENVRRTLSFRKSISKIMFNFSRKPPVGGPTHTMPQQSSTPSVCGEIVELPGFRETGELPTHTSPNGTTQMPQQTHLQHQPIVDGLAAWQRHLTRARARGGLTDTDDTTLVRQVSTYVLNPVKTTVDESRVMPSNASGHCVAPNEASGHSYRPSDNADGVMLLSPQSTLSPFSHTTEHSSPTGSSVFSTESFYSPQRNPGSCGITLPHEGNHTDPLHICYNSSLHEQSSYDHLSPISSLRSGIRHSNGLPESTNQFCTALTGTTLSSLHQLPQSLEIQDDQLDRFETHHSPLNMHQWIYPQSGPQSEISQSGQRGYHYWEGNASEPYTYPFPDTRYYEPMSHPTPYSSLDSFEKTLPTYEESQTLPVQPVCHNSRDIPIAQPKRRGIKRTTATAARALMKLIPPLLCFHCGEEFNGRYQKANRKRHITAFHSDTNPTANLVDDGKSCRTCFARFGRADARRKHEWKKHRTPDSRPHKRRVEKRDGERRIYMPAMPDPLEGIVSVCYSARQKRLTLNFAAHSNQTLGWFWATGRMNFQEIGGRRIKLLECRAPLFSRSGTPVKDARWTNVTAVLE
ncbi:hypothetical protein BU23DRAFT_567080 [Bimuria novae-zelandiae CBS 107.79]|uniref:Uncharacterized protein n=1 Tax=Bimuria novae-zelandiae CBS 107.79 TaxID=1447943 RepID=A0A6A5VCB7_9PLEO|nr:hypothetical protein BU23DRAFT_567080 [Bimuria novae-zelandiae CBS 107.79]